MIKSKLGQYTRLSVCKWKTRKYSSRMCTACLPTVHALVVTRCQYSSGLGVLKWTSFKRSPVMVTRCPIARGGRAKGSHVWCPGGQDQDQVPCIVWSNASWVMVTWGPPVDRQTWLKALPSHNFVLQAVTSYTQCKVTHKKVTYPREKLWLILG